MEIWKDITGYEGCYQVSSYGNVRSLNWRNTGAIKNLFLKHHPDGYKQVELFRNGTKKMVTVHRLVATEFLENPNNCPMINHIDENKSNNRVENLEWCTASYNVRYSQKTGSVSRRSRYTGISIEQKSLDGKTLRIWEDVKEVVKCLGYNGWSIIQCCNEKRSTAYGFKWHYAV